GAGQRSHGCGVVCGGDDHLTATGIDGIDPVDVDKSGQCRRGVAVDTSDDHVVADVVLQLFGRTSGEEASGVDDADPIGELVGLFEVLGGEKDRHAELVVETA